MLYPLKQLILESAKQDETNQFITFTTEEKTIEDCHEQNASHTYL